MDRHTCKLCFRRFSNGRALGGHMRSHAASGSSAAAAHRYQLLQECSLSPSSSSASRGELDAVEQVEEVADQEAAEAALASDEAKQLAFYGLRENPKKSFKLVDPEFSSTFVTVNYLVGGDGGSGGGGASSVVLQDWESDTESSKPPALRRRSKRRRRFSRLSPSKREPSFEFEPLSSVSDTTPEEDVARSLMMLSRDVWTTESRDDELVAPEQREKEEGDEEEGEPPSDDTDEKRSAAARSGRGGGRSRFQCGTCRKVFRSYQALGGHRASHKKIRSCAAAPLSALVDEDEEEVQHRRMDTQIRHTDYEINAISAERRIHECPVCFRVFSSGQALGGHKRSHLGNSSIATNLNTLHLPNTTAVAPDASTITASAAASSSVHISGTTRHPSESLIDLNLPAIVDEEVELCCSR